jgi:hypothetical protein
MTSVDPSAWRARNLLIALFTVFCGLDFALVILVGDVWAIARILLNIVVMVFVVRGQLDPGSPQLNHSGVFSD